MAQIIDLIEIVDTTISIRYLSFRDRLPKHVA
jgi:hypothetical protein